MIPRPYNAPDEDLWRELRRALSDIQASLSAHQNMQRILDQVEAESAMRAARKPTE